MGKRRKSKNLKKLEITRKPLKYGYLTTNTLIEEIKVTDTVIMFQVENYWDLSLCIPYTADFVECNDYGRMCLIRNSPEITIGLITNDVVSDIIFLIRRSNGKIMEQSFASNISNVYYAKFEEQHIFAPSENLFDDTLIIQCIYTARPHENTIFLTPRLNDCSELKTSDVDALFTDLKNLYLTARFYDFIFKVGDVKFKVHKLILFSHSKYLARKLREDPNWSGDYFGLSTDPTVMHQIFLYLYSGELISLDVPDMFQIYCIACELEIRSLQEICFHFLKSTLTVHNALGFQIAANIFHKPDLEREVVQFLNKQPELVRKSEVWAAVIAEVQKRRIEDVPGLNQTQLQK